MKIICQDVNKDFVPFEFTIKVESRKDLEVLIATFNNVSTQVDAEAAQSRIQKFAQAFCIPYDIQRFGIEMYAKLSQHRPDKED